jgi:ketosteroid isomerase-like protein
MPFTLTPGHGQDLLARLKRAMERRDPEGAMALFAEDAELRPDPFEPPLAGSLAIRGYWNELAASRANVEFDAERTWVAGDTVLTSWHAAFTQRRTGERIRQRGFMSIEVAEDGEVRRLREWTVERSVGLDSTFDPRREPAPRGEAADGR